MELKKYQIQPNKSNISNIQAVSDSCSLTKYFY